MTTERLEKEPYKCSSHRIVLEIPDLDLVADDSGELFIELTKSICKLFKKTKETVVTIWPEGDPRKHEIWKWGLTVENRKRDE
jgi:hypothetical protein